MANKTALVIGGTGPTGPFIVEGLVERGWEVTILHRGFHDVMFVPSTRDFDVEIRAQVHRQTLQEVLVQR